MTGPDLVECPFTLGKGATGRTQRPARRRANGRQDKPSVQCQSGLLVCPTTHLDGTLLRPDRELPALVAQRELVRHRRLAVAFPAQLEARRVEPAAGVRAQLARGALEAALDLDARSG